MCYRTKVVYWDMSAFKGGALPIKSYILGLNAILSNPAIESWPQKKWCKELILQFGIDPKEKDEK